jgi:hypothetical protein
MRILLALTLIMAVPSVTTAADDRSSDSGSSPVARVAPGDSGQSDRQPARQFGHIIPQTPAISGAPKIGSAGHILPSPMSHQRVAIMPSAAGLHRPRRQGPGVGRQAKGPPVASEQVRDLTLRFDDLPTREPGLW